MNHNPTKPHEYQQYTMMERNYNMYENLKNANHHQQHVIPRQQQYLHPSHYAIPHQQHVHHQQQPKYNQQNLRYQPRHHPQPQQYQQYPRYQYYHPQYPLYQQKNKIPTIDELCIEKGYVKGTKKPIINKRTPKIPTVDEICIEKGYLKPSVKTKKKTSTVSSGELLGGLNSYRPKKTQKSKPKPRKSK